jgi:hypothetical protein
MDDMLKFNIFFGLFWLSAAISVIGVFLLVLNVNSIQNASLSLGIMAFSLSMSWICMSNCNNLKNEWQLNQFKHDIKKQLDRIENNINK